MEYNPCPFASTSGLCSVVSNICVVWFFYASILILKVSPAAQGMNPQALASQSSAPQGFKGMREDEVLLVRLFALVIKSALLISAFK